MTQQYTDDDIDAPEAERSDAELITAVRGGDEGAFATLWGRHEGAARRLARQIGNPSNADDLVSEAFLRVLRALKGGSGPDGAFRPYLFSTLRRINIDNGRSYYTRIALTDDEHDLDVDQTDSAADVLVDNADSSAAWRAWNSLPDATKTLLWHLIIEEETPAQIAPLIGTTPNGVSSRAVRAKERLRQAFLQQHLLDADNEPCRQARRRFGEYVRDALSARDRTEVRAHLDTCDSCKAALFEVSDINQTMKLIIGPAVLGGLTVAGYIAAGGASATKAGIFAHLTHIGHALKNPAVAASTAAATVVVAGVAVAGAYVVHSVDASDNKPTAVAAASPSSHSAIPTAIAPIASPTSIVATPTPPPTPTPTPTPKPTPTKAKTTPKKAVVPVVPVSSVVTTAPTTPPSTPPPVVIPSYQQSRVAITPGGASPPGTVTMIFTVPSDWVITNVVTDEPFGNLIGCGSGSSASGTSWSCSGFGLNNSEQGYTVTLSPASAAATPMSGENLSWTYTDANNSGTSALTGAEPITTTP